MKGKITRYHKTKGYGFIRTEDNQDVFFHITDFEDMQVMPDDEVEFETAMTKRGKKAVKLKLIKKEK
jgi:cold shock CspA family protein